MLTKTKIALAVALTLGAASAAQAAESAEGGFIIPGSMDGVNPAYHPQWFPGYAAHNRNAGNAYGYVASPTHTSHARTHDR
jgi:hypothetical protein